MTNSCLVNSTTMSFLPMTSTFQQTVLNWFEEEHVKEYYYGEGLQNTFHNLALYCQGINNNGRYSFDLWIALLDDIPFGFLMTSLVTGPCNSGDECNKWYVEGKQTFTLDLLIGPKEFLGKGLAPRMIQEFILDKFSYADYFIIDPSTSNPKAIHVYEKAGFKKVSEFYPSYDPILHIMMHLKISDLKSMKQALKL